MIINTNISSLTAQEAAKNTNSTLSSSLEKLSTGLKINKASDDASGLAIADKLRTQVTSINQAVSNGNSAVTLLQIADKSMSEQSNILDTIKAKLIQANTDTTSDDGRESIRKDINKLLEQLDNIAEQTNYNGKVLLQDSATSQTSSTALTFQVGETKNDTISNNAIQANTQGLGGGAETLIDVDNTTTGAEKNNTVGQSATMKFQGNAGAVNLVSDNAAGTSSAATKVNVSGIIGTLTAEEGNATLSNLDSDTALALQTMFDNGVADLTEGSVAGTFVLAAGGALDFGELNVSSMQIDSPAVAAANDPAISITAAVTSTISVTNLSTTSGDTLDLESATALTGGDTLSSLAALGTGKLTQTAAAKYQGVVDQALTDLNGFRGDIGSTQNQVESAVRNLMTQSTNVAAAESIIRDVDYAEESANFNKQNIISQAGSYAISQANSAQQNVLKLLQ